MLWLLAAVVPLLVLFYWWAWRKRQELIGKFVQSRLLANLTVGISAKRQKARMALLVAAVATIIFALARPQWGFTWEEARQRGLDIIVALDTSRSMLAQDITPSRLERAKLAALDLMQIAKTDRLGLVAFAGSAFLQCPLTIDNEAFRQSVLALDTGIIPQGGTALAEAIDAAREGFAKSGDNHKILIIFTDGEDHDGEAVPAAKKAAEEGMRIFTIGVGTPDGDLLRVTDEKGNRIYLKDDEGNVIKSRLNQSLLLEVASETKGFYLPLAGARTIDKLYEEGLAPLPKSERETKFYKRYNDRFQWPLGLAILLLIAEMFFPQRRRVPVPEAGAGTAAAAVQKLAASLVLLLLPLSAAGADASPSAARKQFENGDYPAASKEYQRLLKENPTDARLHYNAGAAAYREGRFADAAQSFDSALLTPDVQLQQRAYYNRGNALFRQGEADPGDGRVPLWEDAIHSYERALKLNEQDADARHNLEFTRKALEELKKQQEQQQKQNQKDEKKDDQEKSEQQ
ncbi:MAG: VWA domain-containing protein, partial [Verrucomicrobiota bacterium]